MFKPHFSTCICHNEYRLIVVKKGYCAEGNYERKQKNKTNISKRNCEINDKKGSVKNITENKNSGVSGRNYRDGIFDKRRSQIQKTRKPILKPKKGTGEKEVFEEIAEEREWVCFVTGATLYELTATQFAHVLPKALNRYPLFKLYKPNIVLLSNEAHYSWDFVPRSELRKDRRFDKLFELEEKLKEEYKLLKSSL